VRNNSNGLYDRRLYWNCVNRLFILMVNCVAIHTIKNKSTLVRNDHGTVHSEILTLLASIRWYWLQQFSNRRGLNTLKLDVRGFQSTILKKASQWRFLKIYKYIYLLRGGAWIIFYSGVGAAALVAPELSYIFRNINTQFIVRGPKSFRRPQKI